jgi:mannose-6-phosphate isomerase-like protein (cupin superfamily)
MEGWTSSTSRRNRAQDPEGKEYRAARASPYGEKVAEGKGQMEIIDIRRIVDLTEEKWMNCTLSHVNDSLVRMGIFEGEFHWHHHTKEDEFFYVVSGKLLLDLPDGTMELRPMQGFTVPRGVEHRTRAEEKTVVLMVEGNTLDPKGD